MSQKNSDEQFKIALPAPPDYIFKHRSNRQKPSEYVWGQGFVTYILDHAEYKDGEGNFIYFEGCPFPRKTDDRVEAIYATNGIKRISITLLRFLASKELLLPLLSLLLIGRRARQRLITRACEYYNHSADMIPGLSGWFLKDGYYCKLTKEVRKFVEGFLESLGVPYEIAVKTGEIVGCMFEYDNAYRWRLQDVMTEAHYEALYNNLPTEAERLLKLVIDRDPAPQGVDFKFVSAVKMIKMLWRVPSFKKAFRAGLENIDIENARLDEADIYHTILYGGYNIGGKTLEERLVLYRKYHGDDETKWPRRVLVKSNQ